MSEKLNHAIRFAVRVHNGQMRKTEMIPYIFHPMETSVIASGLTTDENVHIAALLHDVIEETPTTLEELAETFGERVAELVASETEDKHPELPKSETWKLRKEEMFEKLRASKDIGVKILWLSDKLANLRALYRYWLESGDKVFDLFNQKDKREHAWYYRTAASLMTELADTPAYAEYTHLIDTVFGEEKE